MVELKPNPVDSFENLRGRVERFILDSTRTTQMRNQLPLELSSQPALVADVITPRNSIAAFLGFMTDAIPRGDVYLFGGVLRDLALYGKRGFKSDIDLVVEGGWDYCIPYLLSLGARQNKFGGYRLSIGGWPVDIWNARDTWAIREGLVNYSGIASLTQTTVLNWDAILMNWRSRSFVWRDNYLAELQSRQLDIVLEPNPDPLGMAVRVFRHFCLKDAKRVTQRAALYLAHSTTQYSFDVLRRREVRSFGDAAIELPVYEFFALLRENEHTTIRERFEAACESMRKSGIALPCRQSELLLEDAVRRH